MSIVHKSKRLRKELTLLNVYAIATGTTLSAGFFLLPGLAAAEAGPAVVLCYMIAAVPLIPAMFSAVELGTAMPRAGGAYYFLDRSMGPLVGTIGGLGTWMALILKTSFALIGIGAYVSLFLPGVNVVPIAAVFALLFGLINLFGARKSGSFQTFLVAGLLFILIWFIGSGAFHVDTVHFSGFFDKGSNAIIATAGLVYISYVGVTNVASVAEEIKNPERNLPLGVVLALTTAILVYAMGTFVMVGVVPPEELYGDYTPVATTARKIVGTWGVGLVTAAALLAFFSVANAGILSASRYPMAMSRDHLMPDLFGILSKHRTPKYSIYVTVGLILLILILFDPTKIAKLASTFQLLMFAFLCLAVIVMRESRIESYDPGYHSPLYPWMQIIGIVTPFWLISQMGWLPVLFTIGLVTLGTVWYFYYAQNKVIREGGIYHIFARLGQRRFEGLDRELRGILKEKGLREEDPFEAVITRALVVDISSETTFEEVVRLAAIRMAQRLPATVEVFTESFMEGTRVGATPVSHGAALPHLRLPDIKHPQLVAIRCKLGVNVDIDDEFLGEHASDKPVYAFFFLVSPEDNPGQHLRILARIAEHVDEEMFMEDWLSARNERELKEILLRDETFLTLRLHRDSKAASLIGRAICDLSLPAGSLIAIIHRDGKGIIPHGNTVLRESDRLTIIGSPVDIRQLYQRYSEE